MGKDVKVSDAEMNFELFGITPGTTGMPVETSKVHEMDNEPSYGEGFVYTKSPAQFNPAMSPDTMIDAPKMFSGALVDHSNIWDKLEDSLPTPPKNIWDQLEDSLPASSVQTDVTGDEYIDEPEYLPYDTAFYKAMDVMQYLEMIRKFSENCVAVLERQSNMIGLSTHNLLDANLDGAIGSSLCDLLRIGLDSAGKPIFPNTSIMNVYPENYMIFAVMLQYNVSASDAIHKYGAPRFHPSWEDLINCAIARKAPALNADDANIISSHIAMTWCQEEDEDFINESSDDCHDDEDDDTIDGIEIILECNVAPMSNDHQRYDSITVIDIDGNEILFNIDYAKLLGSLPVKSINESLGWLAHTAPAIVFETSAPDVFMSINALDDTSMKIMPLVNGHQPGMTIMGLYIFEEGTFSSIDDSAIKQDDDGSCSSDDSTMAELFTVIDHLFEQYVANTPLSMNPRIIRTSSEMTISDTEVVELLAANDIMINFVKPADDDRDDDDGVNVDEDDDRDDDNGDTNLPEDDQAAEVEDESEDDADDELTQEETDLTELGRIAAESLRTATAINRGNPDDASEVMTRDNSIDVCYDENDADVASDGGDLLMKPFRKK